MLIADHTNLEGLLAENVANLVVSLAGNYSHVLTAATTFGKNFMPRAAALLDMSQISEISEVISTDTFVRPVYAGNAMAKVQSSDSIKFITIRTTKFEAAAETGGSATVEAVDAVTDSGLSRFIGLSSSKTERVEAYFSCHSHLWWPWHAKR